MTQKISREPLKISAFCHLGTVTDPKRSLHTKNHAHTINTEVMSSQGLIMKANIFMQSKLSIHWA